MDRRVGHLQGQPETCVLKRGACVVVVSGTVSLMTGLWAAHAHIKLSSALPKLTARARMLILVQKDAFRGCWSLSPKHKTCFCCFGRQSTWMDPNIITLTYLQMTRGSISRRLNLLLPTDSIFRKEPFFARTTPIPEALWLLQTTTRRILWWHAYCS